MHHLALIGLSHRTAEVETRERAAFPEARLPELLQELARRPAVAEALIVSTCNRVEILSRVEDADVGIRSLEEFLCDASRLSAFELDGRLYRHSGEAAVRHLFRVASSLDSMILGEPQILGQVKSFYGLAQEAGTVGSTLNGLVQAALRTAKRVRSETNIGEYSVSVSSAAVDLARKIFGDLGGRHVLIVGAGKMGELSARHLRRSGADRVRVANRSPEAARALACLFSGEAVPFEALSTWIARSDIVITSTGARDTLVDTALASAVMEERKNAPIVFIDISVPRNVDPAVGGIEGVFCYDIDDLGTVVEANIHERQRESGAAERIVEQEVAAFWQRFQAHDVIPVVAQVRDHIQEICRSELERYLRRAGPRSQRERDELEQLVLRIAGKIAHPLISHARSAAQDPLHPAGYVETIRRIFKLEKSTRS
ncbi:MAG: glutamyl-tRNA reductase [Alphaproteobacteria bacterium]|nr:glutamyl-tRNA reductase [Alphaproteobacteria bacterium]